MSNKRTSRKQRQEGDGNAAGDKQRSVHYVQEHVGNRAMMPMHMGAYPLPYNQYQHPPTANYGYPAYPSHAGQHPQGHHHGAPTPPTKRPRTDARLARFSSGSYPQGDPSLASSPSSRANHLAGNSAPSPRRTFSDFRIASITVGTWQTCADATGTRDSRIRFYFRHASDREASPSLSAAEQAVVSPDRISISCCDGQKRIVIPAHHVKQVTYLRTEGVMLIETDGWAAFQELIQEDNANAGRWQGTEEDLTGGQLAVCKKIRLVMDQARPLTEPKWARATTAGEGIEPSSRFSRITRVVDIRPAEQFEHWLTGWAQGSSEREGYASIVKQDLDALIQLVASSLATEEICATPLEKLLDGLSKLVLAHLQTHEAMESPVADLCRRTLLALPAARFSQALESRFLAVCGGPSNPGKYHDAAAAAEAGGYGFKRQRGESEVPSDALARATLDEKRRRLSESGRGRTVQDAVEAITTPVPALASPSPGPTIESTTTNTIKAEASPVVGRLVRRSESADGRLMLRPLPPWSRRYFEQPEAPQEAVVDGTEEEEEDSVPLAEDDGIVAWKRL
ncbi:hypothetical protein BCR37DRAFT_405496 [Protomyces lactucae-debilis]|uniref:Uncharacterized protein n=1 Tax=Protomyces lactucae-debilis TaxID=2754530 RepID=A0A1Y2F2V0_PROLT|nr:uncharacterized protein BCR37DRAFT_405496 [Protomyces lactucae-debilis]ORY78199.1 hypothetical protein BCR37DRAFT_405496 [Protomyces lactucae-debilis]